MASNIPLSEPTLRDANRKELQLESLTARRQKVIGGDLTGVSEHSKRRYGWFSRRNIIRFCYWIASALVALVIAAFFWPHQINEVTKEVSKPAPVAETFPPFYTESRIDNSPEELTEKSFVRENDIQRAAEFRAQQEKELKVNDLLAQADQLIAKNHLTLPEDLNAILVLQELLSLDPRNVEARQKMDSINDQLMGQGYVALKNNNELLASNTLKKLTSINSDSEQTIEFSASFDRWRKTQQLNSILSNADKALANNNLVFPANESALHYYNRALEIDAENANAKRGIKTITKNYINKTNAAIKDGRFDAASGYLATVSVIDSSNTSIALLQQIIAKGEPLAAKSTANTESQNTNTARDTSTRISKVSSPGSSAKSDNRTPALEAQEQELFDQQYLERGLNAYYKGEYDTAAALLQPLADKGISRAQFRIAYMYYRGRGFKKSTTEADKIVRAALPSIRKFAEQGRSWAQSDLGSLYEDGLVLPKDDAEAVYWYRSSAEQGYAGAQTNLGIMYADGRGVSTSKNTAIEWFEKAAAQGDELAKRNLQAIRGQR